MIAAKNLATEERSLCADRYYTLQPRLALTSYCDRGKRSRTNLTFTSQLRASCEVFSLATEINFEAAALSISASNVGHGGMQYRISGRRSAWFFLYAEKSASF
jgi:hypothetical protein